VIERESLVSPHGSDEYHRADAAGVAAQIVEGEAGAVGEARQVDPGHAEGFAHGVEIPGRVGGRVAGEVGLFGEGLAAAPHRFGWIHSLEGACELELGATEGIGRAGPALVDEHYRSPLSVGPAIGGVEGRGLRGVHPRAAVEVDERRQRGVGMDGGHDDHVQPDLASFGSRPVLGHGEVRALELLAHAADSTRLQID